MIALQIFKTALLSRFHISASTKHQPINLPTYQSTNLPVYQLTNLPTYQPTNP
ncbi:MAG: hypothetical protein ABIG63_02655 [Chloroflexota bacterium]